MESGRNRYPQIERVDLPLEDSEIEAQMQNQEASRRLYDSDPVRTYAVNLDLRTKIFHS